MLTMIVRKTAYILLALMIAATIVLASTTVANAAAAYKLADIQADAANPDKVSSNINRCEVNGLYFWINQTSGAIYVSESKTGTGRRLISKTEGVASIGKQIMTNGQTIYYTCYKINEEDPSANKGIIYKVSSEGGDAKKIVSKTVGNGIVVFNSLYNNKLFYTVENNEYDTGDKLLYVALGAAKRTSKKISGDFAMIYRSASGRYVYGTSSDNKLKALDCKTGECVVVASNADAPKISSSTLYYVKTTYEGSATKSMVYKCAMNGQGTKSLVLTTKGLIGEITSKYIYYTEISSSMKTLYKVYNQKENLKEEILYSDFKW